jgi:hypothetical protein
MRGLQATYRITSETTTTLAQSLLSTDAIIYVTDASRLSEPNVELNIWGVITIDGERIMYRERNTVNNTISSLLRGTAGTGAADHSAGAEVYDMGRGNIMPTEFQNYVVSNLENNLELYPILGDGSTEIFVAEYLSVSNLDDSTDMEEAVEVYVGGTLQTSGYTITDPGPMCTIEFDTAPADGVQVTILVRRGVTWYQSTDSEPSNGVPLQDTNTKAARFLRGII